MAVKDTVCYKECSIHASEPRSSHARPNADLASMPAPIRPRESSAVSARAARAAILSGALWLQGCRTDRVGDLVAQERASVVAWTLSPGGTMTAGTELTPTSGGVAATWNVSTRQMTWSDYKTWIRSRVTPNRTRRTLESDATAHGDRHDVPCPASP
jgi:hypothetical protein